MFKFAPESMRNGGLACRNLSEKALGFYNEITVGVFEYEDDNGKKLYAYDGAFGCEYDLTFDELNKIFEELSEGERETCVVSNRKRIIKTYTDEVPWYAYGGNCDTTGSMIWYVEGGAFDNLTVLKEYEVSPNERWADLD